MEELPNQADFAALYSKCHIALLRYVMTMIPDRSQADDVLQETARQLWQKFDKYDPAQPFLPWARKFAYYEALKHRRSYSIRQKYFSDELVEVLADEREIHEPVLEERRHALEHCLGQIDGPARSLLIERYAKEKSIDEVARSQGKTANALYLVLHRLRKILVECVSKQLKVEGWAS